MAKRRDARAPSAVLVITRGRRRTMDPKASRPWSHCGRATRASVGCRRMTRCFNRVAVVGGPRIVELKREINDLRQQRGEPAK